MNIQEMESLKNIFLSKTDNQDCIYKGPVFELRKGIKTQGFYLYPNDASNALRIAAISFHAVTATGIGWCVIHIDIDEYNCHNFENALKLVTSIPFVSYKKLINESQANPLHY